MSNVGDTFVPTGQMQVEIPHLIEILGEYLYPNAEVAIREMLQNAHDSVIKREIVDRLGFDGPGRIDVDFDEFRRVLTISDNGVGMTAEEIQEDLATIGVGGTARFKQTVETKDKNAAKLLIGQFGLGLLSAFIVAKRVEVITKSFKPESAALRWQCQGSEEYSLGHAEKDTVGTVVILHLKESNRARDETQAKSINSLLNEEELGRIIVAHADFLSVPVFLRTVQINSVNAPWHNPEAVSAEYVDYVSKRFPDIGVLEVIPIDEQQDDIEVKGVLFVPRGRGIPMVAEYGRVDIYIRRIFNSANDPDMLPEWARFVTGVIDSPSLTPTLSREGVVRDRSYAIVQHLLGLSILEFLRKLDKKDHRQFREVVTNYNLIIKTKAVASKDDSFFNLIANIVLFDTSEGKLSLPRYFEKLSVAATNNSDIDESTIYFFDEASSGAQEKTLFKAKGIPVIDGRFGAEEAFLRKYAERHDEYTLKRLEATDESIFKEDPDPKWARLIFLYNSYLNTAIEAKVGYFEPKGMPAVLLPKYSKGSQERLKKLAEAGELPPVARDFFRDISQELSSHRQLPVLYLNAGNSAVQQLNEIAQRSEESEFASIAQHGEESDVENEVLRTAMVTLYNNALMFGGFDYLHAGTFQVIMDGNTRAVEQLISMALKLGDKEKEYAERLEAEIAEVTTQVAAPQTSAEETLSLTPYRSCFLAMPFQSKYSDLQDQLRSLLDDTYGVKLISADKEIASLDLFDSIYAQIGECHFGIAEVTENNRNVLIEVGLMLGAGKAVVLLVDTNEQPEVPADLQHKLYVPYKRIEVTHDTIEYAGLRAGMEKVMKHILKEVDSLRV